MSPQPLPLLRPAQQAACQTSPLQPEIWEEMTSAQQQEVACLLAALLIQYRRGRQQKATPATNQESNHERPAPHP
jgi:predicted histidine transporter YuiF (NhaC family)